MTHLDLDDLNLPIALRRTRRTGTGTVRRSPTSGVDVRSAIRNKNPAVSCTRELSPPTPPTTPRQNLLKNKITKTKTVRRGNKIHFSTGGTGMQLVEDDELSLSTGLTPMVRRTSLQPPSPAPKCLYKSHNTAAVTPSRRRSAPTRLTSTTQPGNTTSNPDLFGAEATSAHLLPLRQSHKRRSIQIRRNASLSSALSEEKMNRVYTERRKREKEAQEAQEEIERLRAELKEKNETIERFQNDDTVELELPLEVDAGRVWELERGRAVGQAAVVQQLRSPETPSNPTFHTALSVRRGEDLGGDDGDDRQHMGMGMTLDHPHRHHYDPGSGSETEALSLTTSQFGEAIRAQLDCSTPPPSGSRARHRRPLPTTTATATAAGTTAAAAAAARVGTKPFPSPPTTSPMGMAMTMMPVTGHGTELPITPCSNSRHGGSALSSRRTSNATTIHAHNLNEGLEDTPTRASGSASSSTRPQQHHQQSPSSPSTEQQTQLQTLTTQNTTLQASLDRTQRSLRVALQMVKKLQLESEHLRGETLLLQREKRELMEVVNDVQGMVRRRDEMWRGRMRRLGEGIVEGVRGAFEEVIEEGLDSGVGVEVEEGLSTARLSRKRKRGREEDDDADEEDQVYEDMQEREGGDGESCDLGSGNSGAGGGSSDNGSYDDGLEDMERRIMRVRERMMRKRRRRTGGFGPEEETDPDA
ncbi:hypothetical protein B0H65DRAFT_547684 [Neurospora tetraspora]|uniref:Uncharacterized protein n=1 Tax=Neurospora tetraspora TaxID=94610 RepID=A0AAE0MTH6_9PEZI|nr:hypothetical protein B0H65DRAFT_547684 [Neurospora tetraspora]